MNTLEHFLKLAGQGGHVAASGGEKRAWHLAKACLDHGPGLDANATNGLIAFLLLAQRDYPKACELFEEVDQGTLYSPNSRDS